MSELEEKFLWYWHELAQGYPEPEREYRFAAYYVGIGRGVTKRLRDAGLRDWRFDFAWPMTMKAHHKQSADFILYIAMPVAAEVHGGIWKGGHQKKRFIEDRHKINAAISLGWKVYEFTADMLKDDPAACIELVKEALNK